MDYSTIRADESVGRTIGRLYLDTPEVIDHQVRWAYLDFTFQVRMQFAQMLSDGIKVYFVDEDPYPSAEELFEELSTGRMRVWKTQPDQPHPLISPWDNNRFRAVHDYYGHFLSGRGFDRHGEEAAWTRHSRMFYGPGRRAMTTETRGQSSAFIWINGGREFPPQRAVLLPEWVSEAA